MNIYQFLMQIHVTEFLPSIDPRTGSKINIETSGSNLRVSCFHKGLPQQNQPKDLIIPEFIDLDEKLGESLGLYFGDGTKAFRGGVEFCNSSPELAENWLNHLESFGIDEKKLHFSIKLSENSVLKYKVGENELNGFWRSVTSREQSKVFIVKNNGHKYSTYLQKYGSLRICYNDTMFSIFYNSLIKGIPFFIEISRPFLIGFMRGVIAAEGNINLSKCGSLNMLRIAGTPAERKFISNVLHRHFGIASSEDENNQIYISGYRCFTIVRSLNLHVLHPDKREKLEGGFAILEKNKNRKSDENCVLKNKTAIKLLKMLEYWNETNLSNMRRELRISKKYIRMIMNGYVIRRGDKTYKYNGLVKLNLVSKRKLGWYVLCRITREGKEFLRNSEML